MQKPSILDKISSELLLETMAEGVLLIDLNGEIKVWNQAMTIMTGYNKNEALGQNISWLRAPNCQGANKVLSILNSDTPNTDSQIKGCECEMIAKSGNHIPVMVNAKVLFSNSGEIMGILQTLTDFRTVKVLRQEIEAITLKLHAEGSFEGIIGKSSEMQKVFRMISLAAESEATVMILGNSGTGKELVATAIHNLGNRKDKNFIKVNCGAIPETLLESELFGHEKGSFTGAYRKRIGRFEMANNGTIFLDEIGDISHTMQVKLLRVLQEGEFERVGGEKTHKVNVRVIAATNKDLLKEVAEGNFREDLYYRLRVFPLQIPPLHERPSDVPHLVQYFINRLSAKVGKLITGIEKDALTMLCNYKWPGNVRELENSIEYAFVVCQKRLIGIEDLPEEISLTKTLANREPLQSNDFDLHQVSPIEAKRIVRSKQRLIKLLEDCIWNKAEAGRTLGMSRTAVWKWMKKHRIPLKQLDYENSISELNTERNIE